MFDIGWSELLVIGVVALIAIGPKELPGVLRSLGQWMTKIRSMASEFQGQFQEAMREAEMADLKKQVDDVTSNFNTPFDPAKALDSNWSPDSPSSTMSEPSPAIDETPADAAVPPIDATVPMDAAEPPISIPEPVAAEPQGPEAPSSEPPNSAGEAPQSAEAGKP